MESEALHAVQLGSKTSCLGVACTFSTCTFSTCTFSSMYHTAVGILRPKGPNAVELQLNGGDKPMCC